MGRVILITGGARSGKSAHALALARSGPKRRLCFLATAEALDDEMAARIARHKAARSAEFQTVEEPRNLASALVSLEGRFDAVVIDCLTLWVSNLMGVGAGDDVILAAGGALAGLLRRAPLQSIVVTDEVGAGIVPENPTGRRFRDLLGWTNQTFAREADEVIMMVAGCPLRLK